MKNKKVLCMSGWAQKPSSLSNLLQNKYDKSDILDFDYSVFANIDDFYKNILDNELNPEVAVGWSLGGQLLCRLIEKKIIRPKLLILISTPFQFVKSAKIPAAMPRKSFDKFHHDFVSKPDKTLKKFALLMNINDKNGKELASNLDIHDKNHQNLVFWLDELARFSCFDIDFNNFPKTIIFHGKKDMVVHESQSAFFKNNINKSLLFLIKDCGHAPIANNSEFIKNKVKEI
jgi:esterase/lipase